MDIKKLNIKRPDIKVILGIIIIVSTFINIMPQTSHDLLRLLWSCDLLSLILGIGLIWNIRSIYFFTTIIIYTTTLDWIIDYILALFGIIGPKTAWMFTGESITKITISITMHMLLFSLATIYFIKNIEHYKRYDYKKNAMIIGSVFLYTLLLINISLNISSLEDNINCVFYECGKDPSMIRDSSAYTAYFIARSTATFILITIYLKKERFLKTKKNKQERKINK